VEKTKDVNIIVRYKKRPPIQTEGRRTSATHTGAVMCSHNNMKYDKCQYYFGMIFKNNT